MNHMLTRRRSLPAWIGSLTAIFGMIALTSCGDQGNEPRIAGPEASARLTPSGAGGAAAGDYSSDLARGWFDLSYSLVKAEHWTPPVASRHWGYAGVALYESVQPGMPGHRSLERQVNGLTHVPEATGATIWPVAANAALHTIFAGLYSGASQASRDQIEAHYNTVAGELRAQFPPGLFKKSESYGNSVGQAISDWSHHDGFETVNNCAFTPPVGPQYWVPTSSVTNPLLPCWGQMHTCVVGDGGACDPGLPPAFSVTPGSDFYTEGFEVYQTGNTLTQEQKDIANFWADGGGTGTPPGHWISIVGQVLTQENLGLDVAAEAYAKTGLATMDAFICCWYTKYQVNLLRPVTYIKNVIDPAWTPFIATPPFPEYTSGHSTQSGAAAVVLSDLFGDVTFTDHTHDALGFPARTFHGFDAAADEAAISRLYGGIHFRSAIEEGLAQGRCIGEAVRDLQWRTHPS